MYDHYQAIIFDMDGTLVDSGQLHEVAWIETLNRFEIPIDRPLMRSLAGVPTKDTIALLLERFDCRPSASLAVMNDFKEQVVRERAREFVRPTALVEVARQYQGSRPMSVGTGAYTEEAKRILAHCELLGLIDFVVGADLVANPKPAPDTFLRCAELMGVAPEHCVVFEDSPLGLEAAERAGMKGVDVLEAFAIANEYFL